jgi:SsrA-binding protein
MATKKPDGVKLFSENRRARMRYSFDEFLEVGIALAGAEVKSIRDGKVDLGDAYATVVHGELLLLNAFVAPYPFAKSFQPEPKRARKLLAHRAEIDRLDGKIRQKGLTLVPLKLYLKDGKIKLEIGVGKGKAVEDRRQDIKEREDKREARAAMNRVRDRH